MKNEEAQLFFPFVSTLHSMQTVSPQSPASIDVSFVALVFT